MSFWQGIAPFQENPRPKILSRWHGATNSTTVGGGDVTVIIGTVTIVITTVTVATITVATALVAVPNATVTVITVTTTITTATVPATATADTGAIITVTTAPMLYSPRPMHPAKSVIVFTVTSGAGYGLFVVLAGFALVGVELVSAGRVVVVFAVGFFLVTAGLLSSTLHLANKKNAWRALFRVRTSWLSREGVLALLFYPVALAWGVLLHGDGGDTLRMSAAAATLAVALATLFSTGMIYACLRTIPQWRTPLTPVNYIVLGVLSGALLALALCGDSPALRACAVVAVVGGGACKLWYYRVIGRGAPTIADATGLKGGTVRLLDVGHSAGTFLTDEFGFRLPKALTPTLRTLFFTLSIVVPLALLLLSESGTVMRWLTVVSAMAGLLVERYLFFSDARHVVNLYHGAPHARG